MRYCSFLLKAQHIFLLFIWKNWKYYQTKIFLDYHRYMSENNFRLRIFETGKNFFFLIFFLIFFEFFKFPIILVRTYALFFSNEIQFSISLEFFRNFWKFTIGKKLLKFIKVRFLKQILHLSEKDKIRKKLFVYKFWNFNFIKKIFF